MRLGWAVTGRRRWRSCSGWPLRLWLVLSCLGWYLPCASGKEKASRPRKVAAPTLVTRPSDYEPPPAGEAGGPDYAALSRQVEGAYRATPAPELLYELGVMANLGGQRIEMHDLMRRFLADPLIASGVRGFGEAELLLSLPRPPAGEVQVLADDEGVLLVDGRLVGALPLSLPLLLPVGRHQIRLEMQDKTMKADIDVLDGRAAELRFNRASGAVVVTLPPAAILLLTGSGSALGNDLRRRLQETTTKALQRARLALYDKDAALRRSPALADCLSSLRCQAQLAVGSDVEYLLTLSFLAATPDELSLRLGLVDAEVAAEAATAELRCPRCTTEALLGRLNEALLRLVKDGAGRPRGTLIVRSNPSAAELYLGEQRIGQTPYEHAALAGSLTVRLQKPGFGTMQKTVVISDGKPTTVELDLQPNAPQVTPPPPPIVAGAPLAEPAPARPRWRLITGGVVLGVGLVLVGLGASGVAVDGQCVVPPQPPMINCRDRFDTLGKGAALIGVGAGLSLAGIGLMVWPAKKPGAGSGKRIEKGGNP